MGIEIKPGQKISAFRSPADEPSRIQEFAEYLPEGLSEKAWGHWGVAKHFSDVSLDTLQEYIQLDQHGHGELIVGSYLLREYAGRLINSDKDSSYSPEAKLEDIAIVENHEEGLVTDYTDKLSGRNNAETIKVVKEAAKTIAHTLINQTHETPWDEINATRKITSAYIDLSDNLASLPASSAQNQAV